MKNKIIVSLVILFLGCFLIDKYYIKNMWCLAEDWRAGSGYEIGQHNSSLPYDITEQIKKGECECISDNLIIEDNPTPLNKIQLQKIKKELPNWAINNIKDFSEQDKLDLSVEIRELTDNEFLEKLEYKFTFIDGTHLTCFVPVYVFKVASKKAYCPNYQCVYDDYKRLSSDPEGIKFLSNRKPPNYPIIESESWAINFGKEGI